LSGNFQNILQSQIRCPDAFANCQPVNIFRGDEKNFVVLSNLVRQSECLRDSKLKQPAPQLESDAGVPRQKPSPGANDLERNRPVEPGIMGQVNFTHSAAADVPDDLVGPDLTTRMHPGIAVDNDARVPGHRGLGKEVARLIISSDHRSGFAFQFLVTGASFIQKRSAIRGRLIQRCLQNLFNFVPAFRGHCYIANACGMRILRTNFTGGRPCHF
jgi:hypothetical protein